MVGYGRVADLATRADMAPNADSGPGVKSEVTPLRASAYHVRQWRHHEAPYFVRGFVTRRASPAPRAGEVRC
jgi:hypothetical protein